MASRMQDAALRIAAALEDVTINGRSDAPPDARWLHAQYLDYRERFPAWSFTECRKLAVRDFVRMVLAECDR